MKSSWPILIGLLAVTVAAFVYDARNEASASSTPTAANATASTLATR